MKVYSNRWQCVFLVLYALQELGGACTKEEVIRFIQDAGLYAVCEHDLPPYEHQHEPKYHTLLAWARKDALENSWLVDTNERNAWQISRLGKAELSMTLEKFRSSAVDVRECYLWTQKFKKMVDPSYVPSASDKTRPVLLTEENFLKFVKI